MITIVKLLIFCHVQNIHLVLWLECWFLHAEVDGSNPGISMLCPCARHLIRIASVDSAVKCVPGGDTLAKSVQCNEIFSEE